MAFATTFSAPIASLALAALLLLPGAAQGQAIQKINERELQALLSDKSDTLHVVNFWATWCKPCIKELPYFVQLQQESRHTNLRVTLICLDFPQDVDSRLKPFIARNHLPAPVLLLDARNENEWLNLVDPEWSGAIPATVFYNKARGIYQLIEGELSQQDLRTHISRFQTQKP